MATRFQFWFLSLVGLIAFLPRPALAGIDSAVGEVRTTVLQFLGPFPIQTDISQEIVPVTKPSLPITARSGLDRFNEDESVSAAARAVSLLEAPNTTGAPNDAGLDLSAFSVDELTSWFVEGTADQTRTITLSQGELNADPRVPGPITVSSRVLISGVMVIAAETKAIDLTDVEVNLTLSVTRRIGNNSPETLLTGDIAIVGGPDGAVTVARAAGAFENLELPLADFTESTPGIPLARAVLFAGVELPYQYDVTPGETFDLVLSLRSQVKTKPGGIGAAATFGTPQDAVSVVFERVKRDDRGQQLADAISQRVDTTGQAYVGNPPFQGLASLCGPLGFEAVGLMFSAYCLVAARGTARRFVRRGMQRS